MIPSYIHTPAHVSIAQGWSLKWAAGLLLKSFTPLFITSNISSHFWLLLRALGSRVRSETAGGCGIFTLNQDSSGTWPTL